MRDLRKKALLESGKTTSRKNQRNQQAGSGISTPNMSRAASVVTSRNASDDESEFGTSSLDSVEKLVASLPADVWTADLDQRIESICDRKRSSTEGREESLNAFCNLITYHYAQEELKPRVAGLLPALLKCVKSGESSRETELAMRAVCMIMITHPSEDVYEPAHDLLKATIEESEYPDAKTAAIRALSIVHYYSESSLEETEEVMDFFLDIVSTDGMSIDAEDSAEAVQAALEEWGFLATQFDELPASAESAFDIFIDQLQSGYATVVGAAGDNIALLIEISYGEIDSDDETEGSEDDKPRSHALDHQAHRAMTVLEGLSKQSVKSVSKKDRRLMQSSIADVLGTVEDPRRGPGYSTALDDQGNEVGSRIKVSVNNSGGKVTVDKWWKLLRLNALKGLLQAGFSAHYKFNSSVFDILPAATSSNYHTDSDRPQYASRHMRHIADLLDTSED